MYESPIASIVETDSILQLPSAVPVSAYCESYGTNYDSYRRGILVRGAAIVDAVCGCRMGIEKAMLLFSGTFLADDVAGRAKKASLLSRYGWTEMTRNDRPVPFACTYNQTVSALVIM